jgi:hypothetical protein
MAGANPLYYWDTCLFLAWINDEQRKTGLQSNLPVGIAPLFIDLLKRLSKVGVDSKIAGLAHDLRNYYSERADQYDGKTLCVPDAIHLATAILYRVDEFHTFDEKGSSRSLGLLPLSGDVGGHRLKICKPEARNPELDLRRS